MAEAIGGAVINADAMQVYRELAILTARPDAAAERRAPHLLYGTVPAGERHSAAAWADRATAAIVDSLAAGLTPILVGGTGLYLKALIEGISAIPPIPPGVRAEALGLMDRLGPHGFHGRLAALDPDMAARLAPGDRQRQIRAYEVIRATGRSLAWFQAGPAAPVAPFRYRLVRLLPDRATLYARCDARFLAMIDRGALEEVDRLMALDLPPSLPAMKSLGVPELIRARRGEISLDQAVAQAQQATRNYAKRQMTWFRNQTPDGYRGHSGPPGLGNVHACHALNAQESESLLPEILALIRKCH